MDSEAIHERLRQDPELETLAERLHQLFADVDQNELDRQLAVGDLAAIAETLGITLPEFLELSSIAERKALEIEAEHPGFLTTQELEI